MTIKTKLLIVISLILIPLLFFVEEKFRAGYIKKQNSEFLFTKIIEYNLISELSHELVLEKAVSGNWLFFRDQNAKEEMTRQRVSTDRSVIKLKSYYQLSNNFTKSEKLQTKLNKTREEINNPATEQARSRELYIDLVKELSREIETIIKLISDPTIKDQLYAHFFLRNAKEGFEDLRGILQRGLMLNNLSLKGYANLVSAKRSYQENLQNFIKFAKGNIINDFRILFKGKKVELPMEIINKVEFDEDVKNIPYDAVEWFKIANGLIELLKRTETNSLNFIAENSRKNLEAAEREMFGFSFTGLLLISLTIIISYRTVRGVVKSLSRLRDAANHIAKGNVNINLDIKSKDEIGDLTESFRSIIENTKQISEVANSIGQGQYDIPVLIRSDEDLLGKALKNMKDNLINLSNENTRRTWLLTGGSSLNTKMEGEKPLQELSNNILFHLASYLNAKIGTIYLKANEHKFKLFSTYAYEKRKISSNEIQLGEGLVGQAAFEKKTILFENIPPDYIHINSSLGEILPRNILVWPILFEGNVIGVMELGSTEVFKPLHMEFLGMVSEAIGIAINSSEAREELKNLLKKSQAQAEELSAQQEELRQFNEELSEQKFRLEESREELRIQQEALEEKNREMQEKNLLLEKQNKLVNNKNIELENIREALILKTEELSRTNKYKSEFLANMSHELRTPLNSVLILARLLSENKNQNLDEKQVESANVIYKSGRDLLTLINDILDLSKIEAGKISLEISEFHLQDTINDLKGSFEEIAREKNIEFTTSLDSELKYFKTDRTRLSQALRNILSNAFKFTDIRGKVELKIYKPPIEKKYKSEALRTAEQIVAFSVTDTGIGIPEDKQKITFEAFQQAETSTSRKYGGTGLGLTITREITNLLGGEIELKSSPGKGSIFTIYLPSQKSFKPQPIFKGPLPEKEKLPQVAEPTGKKEAGKRVLIIEDSIIQSDQIKTELEKKGIIPTQAFTGKEAIELIRKKSFDCAILDLKLPGLQGFEILEKIQSEKPEKELPLIIYTSVELSPEQEKLLKRYSVPVVIKTEIPDNRLFDEINLLLSKPAEFEKKESHPKVIIPHTPLQGKKVLIADDDVRNIFAMLSILEAQGINVVTATDGIDALEKLNQTPDIDIILMDIMMPRMDGYEAIKKIRTMVQYKQLPVIALTAKAMKGDREKCLEAGASDYLSKPLESDKLFSIMDYWLKK